MSGIYTLLERDHGEFRAMLEDLVLGHDRKLEEMTKELKAHSDAEEMTFYTALATHSETEDLVEEGKKEHKEAHGLAQELKAAQGDQGAFVKSAKKLQEAVLHHLKEEEGKMFDRARKVLDDDQAFSIGIEFERQKQSRLGHVSAAPVVDSEETSLGTEAKASWPGRVG